VAVFVQRAQIPSLGGGWILRPSTKRGGASSPAAGGTATLASTRFLGSVVVDLIVIFPGGSGCFVLIAGFLCFFSPFGSPCNLYSASEYMCQILSSKKKFEQKGTIAYTLGTTT
jgi:hypothetical protein